MAKGKHARPGYYAKPKFKKSILFVLFSLIILCFILSFLNPVESLENKMASTTKESENNSSDSLNTANVTETAAEVEPVIVEPSEDDNLKILMIRNIIFIMKMHILQRQVLLKFQLQCIIMMK